MLLVGIANLASKNACTFPVSFFFFSRNVKKVLHAHAYMHARPHAHWKSSYGRRRSKDSAGAAVPLANPQFEDTWEDNGETHTFRVRGPGYMSGGGKVDAGAPFGRLVRADLFKVSTVEMWGTVGVPA